MSAQRECPSCGYRIPQLMIDTVFFDFACPRCNLYKLSEFRAVVRRVAANEYGKIDADWQALALMLLHHAGGAVTITEDEARQFFAIPRSRRVRIAHDLIDDTLTIRWETSNGT